MSQIPAERTSRPFLPRKTWLSQTLYEALGSQSFLTGSTIFGAGSGGFHPLATTDQAWRTS